MPIVEKICPATKLTEGPHHHFFGYYEKTPWSKDGRYHLALRVPPVVRFPGPEDVAEIGLIDLMDNCRWETVAQTTAWNWQQGCMVQWFDAAPGKQITYNVRTQDGFGSVIHDLETQEKRTLPMPIYVLVPGGRYGLSLNFSRFRGTHLTISYAETGETPKLDLAPADDGLYRMDLQTGESELILTIAEASQLNPEPSMANALHWFSHFASNPSGTRMVWKHRWTHNVKNQDDWMHRLLVANTDGTGLGIMESTEDIVSHPIWRDDEHVLAWTNHKGEAHYHLYRDGTDEVEAVGADVLDENGHCSYSPDGRWLLTDMYPEAHVLDSYDPNWQSVDLEKHFTRGQGAVLLYHPETNTRANVGHFVAPARFLGINRCDLHARWSRDGRHVSIDSVHEDERQIYLIDVSEVVDAQ